MIEYVSGGAPAQLMARVHGIAQLLLLAHRLLLALNQGLTSQLQSED